MADVGGEGAGSSARESAPPGEAPIDDAGFAVTDTMRRWANLTFGAAVDIEHSTQQFVSHYRSTGVDRRSWPDAWQKWIRDDAKKTADRQQRSHLRAVAGQSPEERGIF